MLGGAVDFSFVAGDTNSVLTVTCKDAAAGTPINLSASTVALKWRVDGGTLVSKTMTVTDAANGVVAYTFGSSELAEGIMVAEVEITTSGKITTSLEPFRFSIRGRV